MAASRAAASVISNSPAPAADARRAVVLTTSPSAVSSVSGATPTAPTKATPVPTPIPIGSDALSATGCIARSRARPESIARAAWAS
jgi:hypothetical protein